MSMFREADSPYRAVFDAARDAMIVYTRDGVIVEANAAACRTYGYARDELIGLDARQAVHPDARPHFEEFLRVVGGGGGEFRCETVDRRRDGTPFAIEVTGTRFTYGGQPHLMSVIRDVTDRRRDEQALRDSEARLARQSRQFEQIAATTPDFIYVFDLDGRFLYANRRLLEVWGRTFDDAVGKNLYELGYPQWHADMHVRELEQVTRTRQPVKGEVSFTGGSGISGVYEYIFTPVLGPGGEVEVIAGTTRDVTDRRRAEGRAQTILESITDAFFALDPEWRFTYVNPQAERVLGRQPGDLPGKTLWGEYPGLLGSEFERAYRRAAEERVATSFTEFYPDHDRWYEVHAYPAPGGGLSVYFRDVTERQQWVATLAETRRKLDAALIAGEVGTYEWDVVRDRLWGDANFERIFGIKLDATGAAPIATYVAAIHPADRDRVLGDVRRSVETGCDYEAEYRVTSTIPPRWVTARGKVERDDAGRVVRFPGVVLDETERKQAELLLAAQNRAIELVAAGAPVAEALGVLTRAVEDQYDGNAVAAILLLDEDGCSLRTGAAPGLPAEYIAAIDGMKAAPGLGTCADAAARNEVVVTPDLAAAPSWAGLAHLPLALGLKAAWSMPIRASDGRVLGTFGTYFRECRAPTERERQVVESLSRAAALAIERRRADGALRESEGRFRQLADAMPQMVWVTRPDGYHEYYNRRWYEFTGVPEGSTDGEGWNAMFHPDDRERAWAAWRHSLATGEPYEIEYRLRHRGGEYRWTLGRALPIRNDRGEVERWFGTCTDIDALKRLMTEREHLLDSERNARAEAERAGRVKDEFLATLSHELRTPLNAIVGWSQILRNGAPSAEDLNEGLATIQRNAHAQTQIIEDLLDMSRIISGKIRLDVQRIDAAAVVRAAVDTMRPAADAKGVRLQAVIDPKVGPLAGDPGRLHQVFWNLISNAIKFTPRGGRVQVLLERVNSHVEVSVIDTGEGIRPEFLPSVFDRFRQADASTTRRHGGLGLGLSIVKQLVELHGGTVRASSAGPGHGSTFVVALPLTAVHRDADARPDDDAERRHPGAGLPTDLYHDACAQLGGVKVLVVDDEADARAVVKRLLEDCAATVTAVATADEAVRAVEAERPDVLVSDIGMPGEDGYSLIRRVRALGPERGGGVPAVALTAYARAEDRVRAVRAGFQTHVVKPVEPAELITMVASLAGRSSGATAR
jgi:PAS domain S-box-containing protein